MNVDLELTRFVVKLDLYGRALDKYLVDSYF